MYVWITTPIGQKIDKSRTLRSREEDKKTTSEAGPNVRAEKQGGEAVELPTEVTKRDLRSVDLLEDDMVHHDKAEWFLGQEKIDVSDKTAEDIGPLLVTELPEPEAEAAMKAKKEAEEALKGIYSSQDGILSSHKREHVIDTRGPLMGGFLDTLELEHKPGAKRVTNTGERATTGKFENAAYYMPADVKRPEQVDADRVLKYERTFYKLDQNVRGCDELLCGSSLTQPPIPCRCAAT